MSIRYDPLGKFVHGITVAGIGNSKNCVHCNEGYCEHGMKVEGPLLEHWTAASDAVGHHAMLDSRGRQVGVLPELFGTEQ
jgi:hypothetical protein